MKRVRLIGACLVAAALLASGCSSDDSGGGSARTSTSSSTSSTKVNGTGTTATTGAVQPALVPPVAVGQAAELKDGVFVVVTAVKPTTLKAYGPGDVAGPGVAVTLELRNDSSSAVDMNGMAINATYDNGTPASPNRSESAPGFEGTLKPGGRQSATYSFRVPPNGTDSIVIDIHHSGTSNVVIVDVGNAVS